MCSSISTCSTTLSLEGMGPKARQDTPYANADTVSADPTTTQASAGASKGTVSLQNIENESSEDGRDRLARLKAPIEGLIRDLAQGRHDRIKHHISESHFHKASIGIFFTQLLAVREVRARVDSVRQALCILVANLI